MSCSTNRTVIPSSRSALTWPSSDCVSAGFTPAIGSSSMTISGPTMSARAISSSLRWPPDIVPAKSSRFLSSLKRRSSSSARSVLASSCDFHIAGKIAREEALALLAGGAEQHVLHDRHARQRLGQLERADHAAAGDLVRRDAGQRLAVERPGAVVGPVEAGEQVEEGALAGAVRPDERGDRAALDLDVVDLDGGEAAEAPGHAVGDEDRVGLLDAGTGSTPASAARGGRAGRRRARREPGPDERQRASSASSLRSPNRPCGLKIMSSMSPSPTSMKRTWPISKPVRMVSEM